MIHTSAAHYSHHEFSNLSDCLIRQWASQGKYVRQFEEGWADLCGVKHALACSSGTAALHLAMIALGIGPGDAVVVPALTYIATANAVKYCRGEVYFADVNPETWCLDPVSALETKLRAEEDGFTVRAVTPVHLYDSLAPVPSLPIGLDVVEDACHAPGSRLNDIPVGSLGRIGVFSFYASKVISCGEGGMLTTNDDGVAEAVRLYRGQGATTLGRYEHSVVGYNYRMTDLQAAVGVGQLKQISTFLEIRRRVMTRYRTNLAGTGVQLQGGPTASGWLCGVVLPVYHDEATRFVAHYLHRHGVETRPFFAPLGVQPPYLGRAMPPVATDLSMRGLCLPTHIELSDSTVDRVCNLLIDALNEVNA